MARATDFVTALRRRLWLRGPVPAGRSSQQQAGAAPNGDFRPDIEGMRAVAVAAVLAYHAGLSFAPGGYVGVDIFLVISGFLITRLIVGELERSGSVSIARFYARRIRRLLPMAVIVLAAAAGLSWLLFSPLRRATVAGDVAAAGVYAVNWRLAEQAINYFTEGLSGSPVQHFWSLAVEEQFYLVWPALLLAATWWRRRAGRSVRLVAVIALAALAAASFGYGVHLTAIRPDVAYFSTLARGWELALGGVLGLALMWRPRVPRAAAAALAWAGIGAVAWSVVRFDDNTLFPGIAALTPTLGTAAVIAAGSAAPKLVPMRLLSLRPTRYVGRISYSWYLWHWPFLVFAGTVWGNLTQLEGLLVVAASAVPTVLGHHWIEEPLRRSRLLARRPALTFRLGAACTGVAVSLGLVVTALNPTVPTMPPYKVVGHQALHRGPGIQENAEGVHPNPVKATNDRGKMYEDGCMVRPSGTRSPPCVYGNPSSDTTVVLFGDSHAMQWFPAIEGVAEKRNWRLVGLTKAGCPAATVATFNRRVDGEYIKCRKWRERAVERIKRENPEMVIVAGFASYNVMRDGQRLEGQANTRTLRHGYASMLTKLQRMGTRTVVVKDNPRAGDGVLECVSRYLRKLRECADPRAEALDFPSTLAGAAKQTGAHLVDPASTVCRDGSCPAVIGNALVYRNPTHLTATYVRTLESWMAERLPRVTG